MASTNILPITVAIPTMNRPQALRRTLQGYLGADHLPAQIIVVGQKILMGCGFLERRVLTRNSLFNRLLTGKKQAFEKFILWILKHCENFISLLRNICQKHFKFPTQRNRE